MSFATILDTLTTIIWSPALVFVCLAVGIFFTISTLFMQIRCIPDMFQQMVGNDDSESGVSSFKALMISLAGRVGVGNIAGGGHCHRLRRPGCRVLDVDRRHFRRRHILHGMHPRPDI